MGEEFSRHTALIFLAILCVFQDFLTQSAAILAAKIGAEAIGTASK